jgi:hypothetical protein
MKVDEFKTVLETELKAVQHRRERMWQTNAGGMPTAPVDPTDDETKAGTEPDQTVLDRIWLWLTLLPGEITSLVRRLWVRKQPDSHSEVQATPPTIPPSEPAESCCSRVEPKKLTGLPKVRKDALDMGLVGLAFSGGGIRSGSVCMGFLQGLAKNRLLRVFDYISTVSGGGYAGAWFAAWVHRENLRDAPAPGEKKGLENVELQLDPSRVSQAEATRYVKQGAVPHFPVGNRVYDQEPEPVHHVRAFSNYLTPRGGMLSADTWTLLAIYLRNTLANLLVLLPAVMLLVVLSRLVVWAYNQWGDSNHQAAPMIATLLMLVLSIYSLTLMLRNRALIHATSVRAAFGPKVARVAEESNSFCVLWGIILPIMAVSGLAVWAFSVDPDHQGQLRYWCFSEVNNVLRRLFGENLWEIYAKGFGIGSVAIGVIGVWYNVWASEGIAEAGFLRRARIEVTLVSSLVLGVILGTLFYGVIQLVVWNPSMGPDLKATFGPPLFMAAFVIAGFFDQWLFSRWLSTHELEWRSRVAATMLMAAVVWLGFFGITLYLPYGVDEMCQKSTSLPYAVVAGWVSTVVGGVFAARNPRAQPGATRPSTVLALLARVGPILFLTGVLALLSVLVSQFGEVFRYPGQGHGDGVVVWVNPNDGQFLLVMGFVCVGIVGIMTCFLDVNTFSLHSLWGNRLIRTFLAASRRKPREVVENGVPTPSAPFGVKRPYRIANEFTGFDAADDFPLARLRPPLIAGGPGAYDGPYPIFNTSLNLLAGQDLAFRDRLAASFVLTPYYCGSDPTGFQKTPYGVSTRFNLTLGRAMTISGAAADPNMPLQSSAQVALLTVLNARMGWWMQNPRAGDAWAAKSPDLGVIDSLFQEALGLTDARGKYIHLSDGGHFDNSGVYELIRRRCRFVVAVDAAEDLNDASENLAAMIRQVRTDLGIRIEIDTSPLRKDDKGLSKWHVAVGIICYDDVDEDAAAGTFFFVRSSLTGDEPADLKNYAARDPQFPHHPTITNQFFDETLFESYRALGYHLADSVFVEAAADFDVTDLTTDNHVVLVRRFFAAVRNRWFPPPPEFNRSYLEAGKSFADLMKTLRTDPNMARLTHDAYPEIAYLDRTQNLPRVELLAVNHVLDVMEMAWLGIDLNGYYAHPLHSGWMGVCRRWAASETFQRYWPVLRGEYCKDFVRFCEQVLNLPGIEVIPIRPKVADIPKQDPATVQDLATVPAWKAAMMRLNEEYLQEWADSLNQAADMQRKQYQEDMKRYRVRRSRGETPNEPCPPAMVPEDLIWAVERAMEEQDPMVWFLTIAQPRRPVKRLEPAPHKHLEGFPIGVLVVYPIRLEKSEAPRLTTAPASGQSTSATPPTPAYYEVIYWVRGPYRSLGLGRQAMEFEFLSGGKRVKLFEYIVLELESRFRGQSRLRLIARFPIIGETSADRLQRALWSNFLYDYDFRRVQGTRTDQFLTLQLSVDTDRIDRVKRVTANRPADGADLINVIKKWDIPKPPPTADEGVVEHPGTDVTLSQFIAMLTQATPPLPEQQEPAREGGGK